MILSHGIRTVRNGWEVFFIDHDGVEISEGPFPDAKTALIEHNHSVYLLFDDPTLYYNVQQCEDAQLTQGRTEESR